MTTPDPFTPPPFLSAEDLRARSFVRHVEIHDTLDSTNNRAAALAHDATIELPALVVARLQTAGRGRGANKWWSADGALAFSLLIDPAFHGIGVSSWPQLSLTTAVAICDALQIQLSEQRAGASPPLIPPQSLPSAPCSIKWPNDVLVDGRKIAGILLESPGGSAPAKDRLILGIGVNVNNSRRDAPADVTALGIALCDATGCTHNLQQLLADLLSALQRRITQLAARDSLLPSAWQLHSSLTGQTITVANNGQTTTGRCLGIADDGALLIQSAMATVRLYSGTVQMRNSA